MKFREKNMTTSIECQKKNWLSQISNTNNDIFLLVYILIKVS